MTTQSSQVVAVPPDPGYAPEFAVRVDGQPLGVRGKDDVLEIHVVLDLDQMASFEITFNNWDDELLRFKYSESEASKEQFKIGGLVVIELGYADDLVAVVAGQITALNPAFPASSSPTIRISGTDGMQKLKDSKPRPGQQVYYKNKADWEIAEQIAKRAPQQDEGRHSRQDRPAASARRAEEPGRRVVPHGAGQAHRLRLLCHQRRRHGHPDAALRASGRRPQRHAGPPLPAGLRARASRRTAARRGPAIGSGTTASAAGSPLLPNLIEFTPTLTAAAQVSRLTVRGWDPRTKTSIDVTATSGNLPSGRGGGLTGPGAATEALGAREDTVIDAPVASVEEARELAAALLRERAYQFITGTGRIAGLPQLRVRDVLEIHGIGLRFSGNYYVTRVEHTLSASGFFTGFRARRIADGSHG